jgi:hypothetical protein
MGVTSVGPTQVGIDSAGNATVARTVQASETSAARLVVRRKPVGGPVEAATQVSVGGDDVGEFSQVIERTGRRTYAYQVAHASNEPFAASRVLRQQTIGGPLGQVWSNDALLTPSIAADGGRLRVVWIEKPDPTQPEVVKTQAFSPRPARRSCSPTHPRIRRSPVSRSTGTASGCWPWGNDSAAPTSRLPRRGPIT